MSVVAFVFFLQLPDLLRRAVDATGGQAALERARSISVVYAGTQDRLAIAQGYYAEKSTPARQQETLIVDLPRQRAAFRTEGSNSDGSQTSWRWMVTPGSGHMTKLKTGRVSPMNEKNAKATFATFRWQVPQLALADMVSRAAELQCGTTSCRFRTEAGTPFTVLFDPQTGLVAGYEYPAALMTGSVTVRYLFKPYVQTSIGLFPGGHRVLLGDVVFKDFDVVDARPAANLDEHPWFAPPPADAMPVSFVAQQPPASVEEAAPGVWFLKNVGGANVLAALANDCVAILDAPATFGMLGGPLPPAEAPPDHAATIIEKVREVTGKNVCYVIPTHHHADHFGGVAGFARAGATIVTSPGNEAIARRVARAGGAESPRIEIVSDRKTFGSGANRFDVWLIKNDPHAEEMLFVHFPELRLAFEGDLSDYVLSAWNFLRFVDSRKLAIDRLYRSHSARPTRLISAQWEEPGN